MNTLIISTFDCTFEEFEKEVKEVFIERLAKDSCDGYEFVKINDHKAHTFLNVTDFDGFCSSLECDEAKEWDKANNCQDTVYKIELVE